MISALDEAGKPVDWWIIYKLPQLSQHIIHKYKLNSQTSEGIEYIYCDSSDTKLRMSEYTLSHNNGALFNTVNQLYGASDTVGRVLYNDEYPEDVEGSDQGRLGHTKGVLGFDVDSDSAFWLVHSTPRYAQNEKGTFPYDPEASSGNENIYGQTFLCISLEGIATANLIAAQMRYFQEPQTYGCILPEGIEKYENLTALHKGDLAADSDASGDIEFRSRAGKTFRAIAKSRNWGMKQKDSGQHAAEDFWVDLVAPHLHTELNVETWRRGTVPEETDDAGDEEIQDTQFVDLNPLGFNYEWFYTKDHAKWAASVEPNWVCIGDINRQTSQEKRGGGAICFQDQDIWEQFSKIEITKAP